MNGFARSHPPLPLPGADGFPPFLWATGIEDTFIPQPHPITGRTLDEYALTEHYTRWREDLDLMASLGVPAARYGIPWYRVCPAPGRYDWSWTDPVLDTMVNTHRIEPMVDLVHYGTPLWLEGSFDNPDYPRHVADYARAFAERYRGLCYWYTPLNEPRVNAWYAGRLGWWPPYGRSWRAFARVMLQLCGGICLTQRAVAEVEPAARFLHVDATDLYVPDDEGDVALREEAALRQEIVFLALDLVMGRFGPDHPLRAWLARLGVGGEELDWFAAHAVQPHVIGCNMYPMYSRKVVSRAASGGVRVRIRPCWTETLVALLHMYADRYAPLPILVSETASAGSFKRRERWIADSCAALRAEPAAGLNVVGYTFWPIYSLVTWPYRNGTRPVEDYLVDMGLWDLRPGPDGLTRVHTPVVDAYRREVARPAP